MIGLLLISIKIGAPSVVGDAPFIVLLSGVTNIDYHAIPLSTNELMRAILTFSASTT